MRQGNRLVRGAILQVGGRTTKIVAGVLAFAVASRALGIVRFSDYVLVFAYVLLFLTLATFGVDSIVIRDLARTESQPGHHERLVRITVTTKFLLAALAMVLCVAGSVLLQFSTRIVLEVALFSPYILVTIYGSNGLLGSILQANHRSGAIATSSTVAAVVTLAGTIVAAWSGGGVNTFLAAYTVAGIVDCALCYVYARQLTRLGVGWNLGTALYLIAEAYPLGIAAMFVLIYVRIDTVLLEKLTDPRQVALYGVAYKFFDVLTTVSATAMLAVFPSLTQAYYQGKEAARAMYAQTFTAMLALALPLTFAVIELRAPLIALIVGHKYADAQYAIPGLMLAVAIIFPSTVVSYMLIVTRQQKWGLLLAILATILNIGLNLWLIPRAGYIAAAWTTAATEVFAVVYKLAVVRRAAKLSLDTRPILLVLLAAVPLYLALLPGIPPYAGGAIGLILYGILMLRLGIVRTLLRQLRTGGQLLSVEAGEGAPGVLMSEAAGGPVSPHHAV